MALIDLPGLGSVCLLWGPRRLWAKRTLVNRRRGGGGRDWDRSHCLEQGVLLLHQREGSGHHKRFRNPGAHLQTDTSARLLACYRWASWGAWPVWGSPGLYQLQYSMVFRRQRLSPPPSPANSAPPFPLLQAPWGGGGGAFPDPSPGPQSFMLEQLRCELDQQILLATPPAAAWSPQLYH